MTLYNDNNSPITKSFMKKTKKQINNELMVIHKMFPSTTTELHRETPFQLLVAVILSAQCTDKQVNKVTTALFQIIKSPKDIIQLWWDKLKEQIKSIGFYKAKALYIYKTAQLLLTQSTSNIHLTSNKEKSYYKEYGYLIARSTDVLTELPWVGIKTAKVVSHILYGSGEIGVDTHVHRVCNRLGRVETNMPEQTSILLEHLIYQKNKTIAHHSIVLFGRYHCTARSPKCEPCPLQQVCPYYKVIIQWETNKLTQK